MAGRRLPVPDFSSERRDGWLTVTTGRLTLRYREKGPDGKTGPRVSDDNLSVTLTVEGGPVVWTPGTEDRGNLGGTYRTLDGVSGAP